MGQMSSFRDVHLKNGQLTATEIFLTTHVSLFSSFVGPHSFISRRNCYSLSPLTVQLFFSLEGLRSSLLTGMSNRQREVSVTFYTSTKHFQEGNVM